MQTLLGAGADINFVSAEGKVPALYAAAEYGHLEIVECLLERDADINAHCEQYGSSLYIATQSDHMPIIKLLLDRGANVNLIGGGGRRALNIAAWNGNVEAVRLLIEHGADIDPDEEYWYGSAVGTASRRYGYSRVNSIGVAKFASGVMQRSSNCCSQKGGVPASP